MGIWAGSIFQFEDCKYLERTYMNAALRITEKADFGLIYDIEVARYSFEFIQKHKLTRDCFIARLSGLPSIGYEMNGEAIGGVFFDGKEAHIAVLPKYHGRWGILLKPSLKWLFSMQDPILSRIEIGNAQCIRFMEKNNWKRVEVDNEYITYEMTAKNHSLFRLENSE